MTDTFQDALTLPGAAGLPPRFFDRFVFNLHPEACAPSVIVGLGVYPVEDVVDGFAIVSYRKNLLVRVARLPIFTYDRPAVG